MGVISGTPGLPNQQHLDLQVMPIASISFL